MSEEAKPLEGGTVDVSAEIPAEPKKRGRGLDLSVMTPEELKTHKAAIKQRSVKRLNDQRKAASYVHDSNAEPNKADALHLLEERGITNPHVLDTVYKLLTRAAEENEISANRFLFANGLLKTLESRDATLDWASKLGRRSQLSVKSVENQSKKKSQLPRK